MTGCLIVTISSQYSRVTRTLNPSGVSTSKKISDFKRSSAISLILTQDEAELIGEVLSMPLLHSDSLAVVMQRARLQRFAVGCDLVSVARPWGLSLPKLSSFFESPQRKLGDASSPAYNQGAFLQIPPAEAGGLFKSDLPRFGNGRMQSPGRPPKSAEAGLERSPSFRWGDSGSRLAGCRLDLKHPPASAGGIQRTKKVWAMTSPTVGLLTRGRIQLQTAVNTILQRFADACGVSVGETVRLVIAQTFFVL